MIRKGNEITIHRNETFTVDFNVVNKDGSPFVVSSKYSNPYVLITVASAKYNQKNSYLSNWWLDLNSMYDSDGNKISLPRFKSTVVQDVANKSDPLISQNDANETVYHNLEDDTYFYVVKDGDDVILHEYEFRIIHHFMNNVTRLWIEQSYTYSIYLVSGEKMSDYLRNLYKEVLGEDPYYNLSNKEMYDAVYAKDSSLVKDINYNRPIVNFDVVQILLEPTKLTVLSDPHGDLTSKTNEINVVV